MKISHRVDSTLRTMVELAGRPPGAMVSASEIALGMGLSQRVVEQHFSSLATKGILTSRRGVKGGHGLARPANQISVAEVISALEGRVIVSSAPEDSAVAEMWLQAGAELEDLLSGITIQTLAGRQNELDAKSATDYHI